MEKEIILTNKIIQQVMERNFQKLLDQKWYMEESSQQRE